MLPPPAAPLPPHRPMKKPTREERRRMCTGKRKYRSEGDALDAARLPRRSNARRKAYLCAPLPALGT